MNDVKLCKDCKWAKPDWLSLWRRWKYAECTRPEMVKSIMVYVDGTAEYGQCARYRYHDASCGPDGYYWEPRA